MASETVKLTHPNGTTVTVHKDREAALLNMGFTKPTAPKTTSKSSSK